MRGSCDWPCASSAESYFPLPLTSMNGSPLEFESKKPATAGTATISVATPSRGLCVTLVPLSTQQGSASHAAGSTAHAEGQSGRGWPLGPNGSTSLGGVDEGSI